MSNEQLLASISEMLDKKLDERLEKVDKRFECMDKRLDRMDKRLDGIDKRLDCIDKRLDCMDKRLDVIEKRLDRVEEQIVINNKCIYDLQKTINNEIRPLLDMLTENYLPAAQKFSAAAARMDEMEQDIKGLKSIVAENIDDYIKSEK